MTFTYHPWRFIGFLRNVFGVSMNYFIQLRTISKTVYEAFAKSSMSLHMNGIERGDCRTTGREHMELPYAKETVL